MMVVGFTHSPRPTPAPSWPKNLGQVLPTPIPHHEATPDPEARPSAEQQHSPRPSVQPS